MNHRPLDPKNEFETDEDYEKAVDTIQNERYANYLFWLKVRRFIIRIAAIFIIIVVVYILLGK